MADKNNTNKFNEAWGLIQSACKDKKFSPVYLFQGDEPYFVSQLADYLEEHALPQAEKSFNQHILYGKDVTIQQILSVAKRFPMMGSHQLVLVKEAQHVGGMDAILSYLDQPLPSTILVFCVMGKKISAATKEGKAFQKYTVFNADRIPDGQMGRWIREFVKSKGMDIDEKEASLLYEHLGNNLSRISSELEKLTVNIQPRKKIEATDIETFIGISREYNVFELQKAMGSKEFVKVNKILKHFADDPGNNPFPLTLAILFGYFQKILALHYLSGKSDSEKIQALKINPYFFKDYQSAARNYSITKLKLVIQTILEMDMKSKGVGVRRPPDAELYKELIVKIIR